MSTEEQSEPCSSAFSRTKIFPRFIWEAPSHIVNDPVLTQLQILWLIPGPLLLKFLPFSSVVETTFWHKLSQLKIDVYALNEEPVGITGHYSNDTAVGLPSRFNVDYSSFDSATSTSLSRGVIHLSIP